MAEIGGGGIDPALIGRIDAITAAMGTKADASAIPVMATVAPPGVADTGTPGTASTKYTGEFHTHASKARKGLQAVNSNVGTYTWTFPTAFANGIVPICNAIAQTATGISDLINVQIDGAATNTGVTFRITRYSQSFLSLLGINILGLNAASIPITLHMLALEP